MGPRGAPGDGLPGEKVPTKLYLLGVSWPVTQYHGSAVLTECCDTRRVTEGFLEIEEGKETEETMANLDLLDQW